MPHQVVDPAWRPGWARIDLREEPDPRAAALAWMNDHASSAIDIEHDPLTINVVLRTGDSDYIWYTRGHHIVIDGYGAMNATTRTAEIYTALEDHTEPVVSRATPSRPSTRTRTATTRPAAAAATPNTGANSSRA